MQLENLFASKPKMNQYYIEKMYLECEKTSHFLDYCLTYYLSNKIIYRNSGQFFLILVLDNTPLQIGNNTSLKIVAFKKN